jgi:hypothetical protein
MNTAAYSVSTYLKDYIANKVSLERYTTIIGLLTTVDSMNRLMSSVYFLDITELEGDLIDVAENDENLGDNTVLVMEKVISSVVMEYLEHIGVFLNQATTFKLLSEVVNGIYIIHTLSPEATYEIETIITDDERDITNKLSYMLSLYTTVPEHQYFEIIEDVDIDFYTRLGLLIDNLKETIVLDNDDMSIVNFISNINKDYDNTVIVSTIRKEGYHDQPVIEYLEKMYATVNTINDINLAALEIAATFYMGIDSRYSMFDYFDLYFNIDVITNPAFDHGILARNANQYMIEIENKV